MYETIAWLFQFGTFLSVVLCELRCVFALKFSLIAYSSFSTSFIYLGISSFLYFVRICFWFLAIRLPEWWIHLKSFALREWQPVIPCSTTGWEHHIHTHTHTHIYIYIYITKPHRTQNRQHPYKKNKMASEEIDPRPHKYWPSVECLKAYG